MKANWLSPACRLGRLLEAGLPVARVQFARSDWSSRRLRLRARLTAAGPATRRRRRRDQAAPHRAGGSGVGKTAVVHELVRRRQGHGLGRTPFWSTPGARIVAGVPARYSTSRALRRANRRVAGLGRAVDREDPRGAPVVLRSAAAGARRGPPDRRGGAGGRLRQRATIRAIARRELDKVRSRDGIRHRRLCNAPSIAASRRGWRSASTATTPTSRSRRGWRWSTARSLRRLVRGARRSTIRRVPVRPLTDRVGSTLAATAMRGCQQRRAERKMIDDDDFAAEARRQTVEFRPGRPAPGARRLGSTLAATAMRG